MSFEVSSGGFSTGAFAGVVAPEGSFELPAELDMVVLGAASAGFAEASAMGSGDAEAEKRISN